MKQIFSLLTCMTYMVIYPSSVIGFLSPHVGAPQEASGIGQKIKIRKIPDRDFHTGRSNLSKLNSVTEPNKQTVPQLAKIEQLKQNSDYLLHPLSEEMDNEEIFLGGEAVQVIKYHGLYQQDNRELRKSGEQKKFQFMLRLKAPAGDIPPHLYLTMDELSDKYGQGDLRATTRQCFQLHGVLKGNVKTVLSTIMNVGSSTIGACGDVVRNVNCAPAPFQTPEYVAARTYSKAFAELFKPQTDAFTDIWLDGEKAATVEYWLGDVSQWDFEKIRKKDSGTGVILKNKVEPLYGDRYLPRKFKIGVTVPGDNSIDIYSNDIGVVVITNEKTGEVEGFNIMVGGGLGRSHRKEETYPKAAEHLCYVEKENIFEAMKAIVATQRDHGNREVRMKARMKYLVDKLGIEGFKKLVETYYGKEMQPWKEIQRFEYNDYMGWYEQGDGKLFFGLKIEQGRVRDFENGPQLKTCLRRIVTEFGYTIVMCAQQSLIFKDIEPADKPKIQALLKEYGVSEIEDFNSINRHSMACPALPLCGLAVTEAERVMQDTGNRIQNIINDVGLPKDLSIITRMTGCPNGCARPYMAELAFVGDGPSTYQVWFGGAENLTRVGTPVLQKMHINDLEKILMPVFAHFKEHRKAGESFGSYTHRIGPDAIVHLSGGTANVE